MSLNDTSLNPSMLPARLLNAADALKALGSDINVGFAKIYFRRRSNFAYTCCSVRNPSSKAVYGDKAGDNNAGERWSLPWRASIANDAK